MRSPTFQRLKQLFLREETMSNRLFSQPTRSHLPVILIRGFGSLGTSEERKNAYYGFNEGTVYPQKQGENYIYEGLILKFMKSAWKYQDATNIVGYYSKEIQHKRSKLPSELQSFEDMGFFSGSKIVIDPEMALKVVKSSDDPRQTLWVFRFYDLNDRIFETYSNALVRLIDFIRALVKLKTGIENTKLNKVNIIAHSMGGLIVRHAIQSEGHGFRSAHRIDGATADESINKIVTLGTPHQGISFQVLQDLGWLPFLEAGKELEQFNPNKQEERDTGFNNFKQHFPLDRLLTVVGTNYRTYNIPAATVMNRLFSVAGEYGPTYNRSDGLVKQTSAQIPGAPRTFVHKSHGGPDSLITARESFEVATRFFFGDLRARIRLVSAQINPRKTQDFIGKSEFFLGISIKPRDLDFELFHQSKEAENCYGPFSQLDLSDRETTTFDWAGPDRLIWEGYLLSNSQKTDVVMRLEFYVGERDVFGIGFSDNLIFHEDYFIRAVKSVQAPQLYLYESENFDVDVEPMLTTLEGWQFTVKNKNFEGTFRIELDKVPEQGEIQSFAELRSS